MKKHKELYFYWLLPAFAIGFGAGKVKGTKIWDISISLGICIIGFRIYNYSQDELMKMMPGGDKVESV